MSYKFDRITLDPNVCGGRPCIRGTRMREIDMLSLLASGAASEEILEDYPYLERFSHRFGSTQTTSPPNPTA